MMNLQTKYRLLKATTITVGALSIPWGTYIGFCFGEGRYATGLIALSFQVAVSLVDGYVWFWVLENMKDKIDKDKVKLPECSLPSEATA